MKRVRKFGIYNALEVALRRAGFDKTGVLTTLLLETFLENDGRLTALSVEKVGLCEKSKFKEWREPLMKAGWLQYDYEYAKATRKGSVHQPGKKLVPYLNKEKLQKHSLVTETQLNRSLAPIESRMVALNKFIRGLIEAGDPPYTEEKENEYLPNPKALLKVAIRKYEESDVESDDNDTSFICN